MLQNAFLPSFPFAVLRDAWVCSFLVNMVRILMCGAVRKVEWELLLAGSLNGEKKANWGVLLLSLISFLSFLFSSFIELVLEDHGSSSVFLKIIYYRIR